MGYIETGFYSFITGLLFCVFFFFEKACDYADLALD